MIGYKNYSICRIYLLQNCSKFFILKSDWRTQNHNSFHNIMGKEKLKNKQSLGQLYRQFSRQKYNKYKHQFPRMRESDIINKIIKEWERLDQDQKVKLFDEYNTRNILKDEKSESEGSQRNQLKKREKSIAISRKVVKAPRSKSVKVQHQQPSNKDLEQSEKEKSIKKSVRQRESESERSFDALKTKAIKKNKSSIQTLINGEYIQFFKYYYERLSQQHPKWTSSQISTIIKLLWKKRNIKTKKGSTGNKSRGPRLLTKKSVSGRMAFKRDKINQGYTKEQIIGLWKRLPRESKIKWQKQGRGQMKTHEKKSENMMRLKAILKAGSEDQGDIFTNKLAFMRKIM